jgi:capsule polysaccharide export protein KpsE/RkpR
VAKLDTKSRTDISEQPPLQEVALGEVQFRDFRENSVERLRLIWEQRTFLAKSAAVGLLVGVLIAFAIPKEYRASVQLMPPDNQSNAGMLFAALASKAGGAGGLGAIAGDLLGIKNSGALFIGILRSRTVSERLVQRFDLKKVYGTKLDEDAREELLANTALSEDRKSGIVTIVVTDRDPQRVAGIAQAYVDELDRLVAELSTSAAHRERIFLEGRLKEVKQQLDLAAHDLSQFSSKTAAIDIKEQGRAMVEAAAVVQGQMIAAESELKGLEAFYTSNNVRVRSVQARIAELQRQLDKLGGSSAAMPTATNNQSDAIDSIYPSIRQLPLLGVTYFDLYRRNKILEVVYETLTQQYELSKVEEAKELPSVKVLDAAIVPERKSFPPRLLLAAMCGFLALAGAILSIFARLRWERVDSADPGKVLAREIFASFNSKMPWATPNGSRSQAMTHSVWTRIVRRHDSGPDQE